MCSLMWFDYLLDNSIIHFIVLLYLLMLPVVGAWISHLLELP